MQPRWTLVVLLTALALGCGGDSDGSGGSSGTTADDSADGNDGADGSDGCGKEAPEGSPCNPYCQTGCEDGQACTFSGSAFACVAPGTKALGEPCNADECGSGLACFGVQEDGGASQCRQFCVEDDDCPAGRRCTLSVNFPGGANATFCGEVEVSCSLFDKPSTCPNGQACYLIDGTIKCADAGTLLAGAPCSNEPAGACAPGLQCLLQCTEVCSIQPGLGPQCADECTESATASQTNGVGFCLTETPPQECDLFAQTGCAEGQGCFPGIVGWQCLGSEDVPVGDTCEFTNDCVAGAACIASQCQRLCNAREDADPSVACTAICETFSTLNPTLWGMGFCSDTEPANPCDFWAQDCQDAGTACYFANNGASCLPIQAEGVVGATCNANNQCAAGLMCVNGACAEVCSIDEFAPPPAPICVDSCPGGDFAPVGSFENQIGVCSR